MTGEPVSCVIYAAKSTVDLRGSIATQLSDCRGAIAEEGDRAVVGEYVDEAISAYSASRGDGLAQAIEHSEAVAAARGRSELWVQHSDRLARGDGKLARHVVEIALWAIKRDVRIRSLQDPDTFRDLLYAVVTGQRNHEDSRRRGAAVEAGVRRTAERGEWPGGTRLDGYRIRRRLRADGHVHRWAEIDPVRKPVIDRIFKLARAGLTNSAIAKDLNDAGWQTVIRGRDDVSRRFTSVHINNTLRNARYAGLSVYHGELVGKGCWRTYISEPAFRRLTEERERRGHAAERTGRSNKRRLVFLLRGLARCRLCDGAVYGITKPTLRGVSRRYVCVHHLERACPAPPFNADIVEQACIARLIALLGPRDRIPQRLIARKPMDAFLQLDRDLRGELREAVSAGNDSDVDVLIDQLITHHFMGRGLGHSSGAERRESPRAAHEDRLLQLNQRLGQRFRRFELARLGDGIEIVPVPISSAV